MTTEYGLWHTIRFGDGSWQDSFGSVDAWESNPTYAFSDAACAATTSNVQVVAVGPGGQLYHTVREWSGAWQPTFGIVEGVVAGAPGPFKSVACAGSNDDFHLLALDTNGRLWHTIRYSDGNWQSSFTAVPGVQPNDPGPLIAIDALHGDDELLVFAVGADGWLYSNARDDDGTWGTTFTIVEGQPNAGGPYVDVAIARADDVIHAAAVSQGGDLWYAWFKGWQWQGSWDAIQTHESNYPEPFIAVTCSVVDGHLHVAGIGNGGQIYHTIRHPNASWQSIYGWVNNMEANGYVVFTAIGSAGAPNELHVVGLAWQHD